MPIELAPANDRGFLKGEFKDQYGENCSIQKSSLASENCIWLGADDIAKASGVPDYNRRMHLTQEMVADLLPILQHFVATGELGSGEAFNRPEDAPIEKWVLAWIHLPLNPPASMWGLAQRTGCEKDEDAEAFKSVPHLRRTAGCWWNGGRYVVAEDVKCWVPLPPRPDEYLPEPPK